MTLDLFAAQVPVWPMHRKDEWRTVGRIMLVRSTNHRVRCVTIFERVSA
jgi:hypothetical protein